MERCQESADIVVGNLRRVGKPALLCFKKGEELRQVAARALADMADTGAVVPLLKAADTSKGFERIKQTGACLQLAENLLALGRKEEATRIYQHLRDTRKDTAEAYIREAAKTD